MTDPGETAPRYRVLVCRGPECGERKHSQHLYTRLERLVRDLGLEERCELSWQSCFGRCRSGPNVLVRRVGGAPSSTFLAAAATSGPGTALYNGVRPGDLRRILEEHVRDGIVIGALIGRPGVEDPVPPPTPLEERPSTSPAAEPLLHTLGSLGRAGGGGVR